MSLFDELKGLVSDQMKEMEKSLQVTRKDLLRSWDNRRDEANANPLDRPLSSSSNIYNSRPSSRPIPPPPNSRPAALRPGMYDPALENLIELALQDGELSDREIAVLFKRAQSMGIDLDEFEMVLQARLQERQKSLQKENGTGMRSAPPPPPIAAPKVPPGMRKCPACGATENISEKECTYCGYVFPTKY